MSLYFTLTIKRCLSQQSTSATHSHTPTLAVPWQCPKEISSSSLIPMLCSSDGGTVWEQTGAAHSRLPVVAKLLTLEVPHSCSMCGKTRVGGGDFNYLLFIWSPTASVWPWAGLRRYLKQWLAVTWRHPWEATMLLESVEWSWRLYFWALCLYLYLKTWGFIDRAHVICGNTVQLRKKPPPGFN